MKKGILVVSFGTTHQETREKNIDAIERDIQTAYPKWNVYRAFSSGVVKRILKERDGLLVMSIEEALCQMEQDGVTHAYIQPTHVIDGIENHKLRAIVEMWHLRFEQLRMGDALLTELKDYEKVVESLWKHIGGDAQERILILMGHGSVHESNEAYEKLEKAFHNAGHEQVYVATVEASPTIEDVLVRVNQAEKKPILVTPFMLVAGDHAVHDMAGDEDSYASRLTEQGYEIQVLLKGLGEYSGIRKLYLEHLKQITNHHTRDNR